MRTRVVRTGPALALTAGLLAGCQSSAPRTYDNNPLLQGRPPLQQTNGGNDRLSQLAQNGPHTVVPPPGYPGAPGTPPTTTALAQSTGTPRPQYAAATTTYSAPPAAGPTLPDPVASAATAPTTPAPLPARTMPADPTMTAAATPAPLPTPPAPPPMMPPTPSPTQTTQVSAIAPFTPAQPAPPAQIVTRKVVGEYGCASDYSWLQGEFDPHYRGYVNLRYLPASDEDPFGGKVQLEPDPRLAEFHAGDIVAVEGELVRDATGAAPLAGQYPHYRIRSIQLVGRQ